METPNISDGELDERITRIVKRLLAAEHRLGKWLTPSEPAAYGRLSKHHLLRCIRAGCGPEHVGERRMMRIRENAMDRWLERKRQGCEPCS
jgi:hypothetical protein